MKVKLTLVDGTIRFMEAVTDYAIGPIESMHPDILEAKVYTDHGRLLALRRRKNWKYYKEHEYKPLPPEEPAAENPEPPKEKPST